MAVIRSHSVSIPLKAAKQKLRERVGAVVFDARYGVRTVGDYGPSTWLFLRRLFAALDVSPDDVFADLGSGYGRVLLVAARRPFKRVVGVEVSEERSAIARENLKRTRLKLRCRDVDVVTADVLSWPIPADLSIVYLFAPFPTTVFERVVERLVESLENHPRRLMLLLNYHWSAVRERDLVLATGRARPIELSGGRRGFYNMSAYELVPAAWAAREVN